MPGNLATARAIHPRTTRCSQPQCMRILASAERTASVLSVEHHARALHLACAQTHVGYPLATTTIRPQISASPDTWVVYADARYSNDLESTTPSTRPTVSTTAPSDTVSPTLR